MTDQDFYNKITKEINRRVSKRNKQAKKLKQINDVLMLVFLGLLILFGVLLTKYLIGG